MSINNKLLYCLLSIHHIFIYALLVCIIFVFVLFSDHYYHRFTAARSNRVYYSLTAVTCQVAISLDRWPAVQYQPGINHTGLLDTRYSNFENCFIIVLFLKPWLMVMTVTGVVWVVTPHDGPLRSYQELLMTGMASRKSLKYCVPPILSMMMGQ